MSRLRTGLHAAVLAMTVLVGSQTLGQMPVAAGPRTINGAAAPAPSGAPVAKTSSPRTPSVLSGRHTARTAVTDATSSNPYTTSTTNRASLHSNATWTDLVDSASKHLTLTVTPTVASTALITGNADLWTDTAGYNQDLGILVTPANGTGSIVAWTESGGYTAFKPNATFTQSVYAMTAGTAYTVTLQWKSNSSMSTGNIMSGAGPAGGPYSVTSLNVLLTPNGLNPPLMASTRSTDGQYNLNGPGGTGWTDLVDAAGNHFPTLTYTDPASGGYTGTAMLSLSASVFAVTSGSIGGPNPDLEVTVQVDNSGLSRLLGWAESGGSSQMNPLALGFQTTSSVSPGHTYAFKVQWRAGSSMTSTQAIRAGAGTASPFSPTVLSLMLPSTAPAPYASTSSQSQYTANGSDGVTWADPGGTAFSITPSSNPSVNAMAYVSVNAAAFTTSTTANVDLGLFASANGGPDSLIGWTEAGSPVAFNADGVLLQEVYPVTQGTSYTFKLKWKSNASTTTTLHLGAGAASPFSPTSLQVYFAPYAVPSSPKAVTATPGNGLATVVWTPPDDNGSEVTSYTVTPYIGSTAQTPKTVNTTNAVGAVLTSTSISGLTNGTTYTFQVTATNALGTGPAAVSGRAVPAPPAPITTRTGSTYSNGSTLTGVSMVPDSGGYDAITPDGNGYASFLTADPSGYLDGTYAQPAKLSCVNSGGPPCNSSPNTVRAVATADFNGDGKLDLAVASGSNVGVMLGNGDGTFQAMGTTYALTRGTAAAVAVADINNDGQPDIVVSEDDHNAVSVIQFGVMVLMNNGSGTFSVLINPNGPSGPQNDFAPTLGMNIGYDYSPNGLAIADVNGDGYPDIIQSATSGVNGFYFPYLSQGGAGFSVPNVPAGHQPKDWSPSRAISFAAPAGGQQTQAITLADLNGDGAPDLVAADNTGVQNGIDIFLNQGNGQFGPSTNVGDPTQVNGGRINAVGTADLNGDGLPEIITTEDQATANKTPGISIYVANGGGSYVSPSFLPTPITPFAIATADLNGDGAPDIVLGDTTASSGAANVAALLNGTDFPPLGGPLSALEDRGFCASCADARRAAQQQSGGYPISLPFGTFWHDFTDLSIAARGLPIEVNQTYNSANASTDAGLGYGWWSNLFMHLSQAGTTATVTEEDGLQAQFLQSGSAWQPFAPRLEATLTHNGDGTWTFTRQGGQQVLSFDSTGRIIQEKDLNGNALNFAYSTNTTTVSHDDLAHSDARSVTVTWSGGSPNHVTQIVDNNAGLNRKVAFTYDASNQLTDMDWTTGGNSATDLNEHFEYETATPLSHRLTGMRDPRGFWVVQAYDSSGRVTSQTVDPTSKDAGGINRQTTYDYSVANQVTMQDNASPAQKTVDVYAYGTLVQRTVGTTAPATWKYTYDPSSLGATTTIDPNGASWASTYDGYGNQLQSVDPLLHRTITTYSSSDAPYHQPTSVTDGLGVATTYTYDSRRNLIQSSRPLNSTTNQVIQYQHTDATHPDDVRSMIDGDGKTWAYTYDANGNPSAATDPLGNQSTATYNADSWKATSISPKGNVAGCGCASQYTTSYAYTDSSGNTNFYGDVTTVTDPLGHQAKRTYDADRNVATSTDPDGNTTSYSYDDADQQTVIHRADTTTLVTDYNVDGTVTDQKDGSGATTQSYTYDEFKRVASVTVDPGSSPHLNQTTSYTYDGVGNLLSRQDPGGSCATPSECVKYTYDAADRSTGVTYASSRTSTPNVTSIQYDADNQLLSESYGSSSSTWQWDQLHRLTQSTSTAGGTVSYGYNLRNLVTSVTYPGQSTPLSNSYDDAGRLQQTTDWLSPANTLQYSWDANSNLTAIQFPAPSVGTTANDTYVYDAADRLVNPASGQPAITMAVKGTNVATLTYGRDANGQITSEASTGLPGSALGTVGYTTLNQVSQVQGASAYTYDAADNPTLLAGGTHQGFNSANQVCWSSASTGTGCTAPSGATTYAYNGVDDRTSQATASATTTYAYDQEHRLCWVLSAASVQTTCTSPPSGASTYSYDAQGLRTSKTTGGTTTNFAWDVSGSLPLLLQEKTPSTSTSYVYGPGGVPVEQIAGTTPLFYHHDRLGSTRLLTDAAGNVQATYTYDAYGNLTGSTGTATNSLLYAGQYRDAESGLYYMRARYYDSITGEFLSRDALVALTGAPYLYTGGDPLNATDPFGLWPWDGLCLRNPFGGDNDNGGCHTPLSTSTGAKAVAVTAAVGATIATGGMAAGAIGGAAGGGTVVVAGGAVVGGVVLGGEVVTAGAVAIGAVGVGILCDNVLFARRSGKDRASDTPSWFDKGTQPEEGEGPSDAARRVLDERYGAGNYGTGPGSEYSQIKKWFSRNSY